MVEVSSLTSASINREKLEIGGPSSQELFAPYLSCFGGLWYHSSSSSDGGRRGRWWRWRTHRIGLYLVTSIFMMTLSLNFNFRDKIPSPEEIDWAQALTWFARTYLPLVVGMARVRICSGGSDGGSWFCRLCSFLAVFILCWILRSSL